MRTSGKPNILLINCDDMGYGDLGCYGSPFNDTPVIDAMASRGARFTQAYSPSPVCSPSRGAMLTGCYPPRISFDEFDGGWVLFPGQGVGMSQNEITIARLLRDEGYATKIIGKWHCGDQPEFLPTRHGFDEYYGIPFSNDMGRQCDGRTQAAPLPLLQDENVIQQQPDLTSLTERYTEKAVDFMRRNAQNPFFLYFAHMHVHLPHYASDNFLKSSRNGDFGGCMSCVDWSVGVMLHELRELGLLENTLVIFTSDNGGRGDFGSSNGSLRGAKATTWEGGMRIPFIAYWEGVISPCEYGGITSLVDLFPTFAKLAGAKLPDDRKLDGVDLLTAIKSGVSSRTEIPYYRLGALEALRVGKWKLHFLKNKQPCNELYDLEADISEQNDMYQARPEIVARLTSRADELRAQLGDSHFGIRGADIRPAGRVENPKRLTEYDPNHPYIVAEYDKPDRG